jgi:transcriptional regulator GlxA family with amidase domain
MAKSIKTDMSHEQLARAYMVARRELERLREEMQVVKYENETLWGRVRDLEEDSGMTEGNRWTT